jgi:hypothetical protein
MQSYSPFFPDQDLSVNYTVKGVTPKTTNTTFYNSKDLYTTIELATNRAYNIGCSGYRAITSNANGSYMFGPCSSASDYKKIMKEMSKENVERRYYDFDQDQNLYDIRDSQNDNLYNGFNYKDQILRRSLSNVIYKDPIKEGILSYFERVVYGLIESTKGIKNFVNYTVKRNNKRVF